MHADGELVYADSFEHCVCCRKVLVEFSVYSDFSGRTKKEARRPLFQQIPDALQAGVGAQCSGFVGRFPSELRFVTAEVAVGGGFRVDRA